MDEKTRKDLTALSELEKTRSGEEAAADGREPTFGVSTAEALPALEGLDDLLAPMAPSESGENPADPAAQTFTFTADPDAELPTDLSLRPDFADRPEIADDPLAALPPVDPEIRDLAAEDDAPAPTTGEFTGSLEPPVLSESPREPGRHPLDSASGPSDAPSVDAPLAATSAGAAIAGALRSPGLAPDAKHYAEHVAASAAPTLASNPYSVLIDGPLRPHEREALLAILSRENLGIREVELEPQFAAGHVLIPRVSEYAGIQIVQALRNSAARLRLGPSERIYAAKETRDEEPLIYPRSPDAELLVTEEGGHRADAIILTSDADLPGRQVLQALDVLHGSINLKAAHVAQPQSPVFQEAMDRLKRQLKFQAHHRGANALLGFQYELHPLEGQTLYKLVVQARAVRVQV